MVISEGEQVHMYKSHIAKKIAKQMTIEQLDQVLDPDDVIFSRLYKKKLEIFFEQSANLLNYCQNCGELFTMGQIEHLECVNSDHTYINVHGVVHSSHVKSKDWDLNEFVMML